MAYKLMRAKWISTILVVLVVGALAGWRIWSRVNDKPASDSLHQKIKTYVAKNPQLQPSYDQAMSDGKLTLREAQAIMDEGKALKQQGKAEAPPDVEE
jgi:predicted negative regulator of RcsB-dependent stress response